MPTLDYGGPVEVTVDPLPRNDVRLVGKLSHSIETRELPSGDRLGKWNLVVARPKWDVPADGGLRETTTTDVATKRRRQSHDTIECVSFDSELIEQLAVVGPGSILEVHGALRRRFLRGQAGQSRYEVEAYRAVMLTTVPPVDAPGAADPEPGDSAAPLTQSLSRDAGETVRAGG